MSADFFNKKETGNRIFVEAWRAPPTRKTTNIAFLTKDENGLKFTDASGNPIDRATWNRARPSSLPGLPPGDDGTPLTGDLLSDATPTLNQQATGPEPEVSIKWNAEGGVIFDQIALRLYNPGRLRHSPAAPWASSWIKSHFGPPDSGVRPTTAAVSLPAVSPWPKPRTWPTC